MLLPNVSKYGFMVFEIRKRGDLLITFGFMVQTAVPINLVSVCSKTVVFSEKWQSC